MDSSDDIEKEKKKLIGSAEDGSGKGGIAHDDVDFTSGFETQYEKEYRRTHPLIVPPPDKSLAWYRDLSTILMVAFLMGVLLLGTIMLISYVFTTNTWYVLGITAAYFVVAGFLIFMEVKSIHVR